MNKFILKTIALTTLALVAAQTSMARERVVLDMYDQVVRNDKVFLKREIKQQNPYLRLKDYNIKKVVVVGKTRRRGADVDLLVGHDIVDRQTVYGGQRGDFHNSDPRTYERIRLIPQVRRQQQGPWQLHVSGVLKIKKIRVVLQPKRGGGGHHGGNRGRIVDLGEARFAKWNYDTERFAVRSGNVTEVLIEAKNHSLEIYDVVAVYTNGQRERLWELSGSIYEGQIRSARVNNYRQLSHVLVTAMSLDKFSGKAVAKVSVKTGRR